MDSVLAKSTGNTHLRFYICRAKSNTAKTRRIFLGTGYKNPTTILLDKPGQCAIKKVRVGLILQHWILNIRFACLVACTIFSNIFACQPQALFCKLLLMKVTEIDFLRH